MESANLIPDVVIVSAFGRGHWLATELCALGWSVTFVDTTKAMGPWEPEDWEGPWGFFDTSDLTPTQRRRLLEIDQAYPLANGFTLWTKNGPIEFGSPLTEYQFRAHGISDTVRRYLEAPPATADRTPTVAVPRKDDAAPGLEERQFLEGFRTWTKSTWISQFGLSVRAPSPVRGRERLQRRLEVMTYSENWLAQIAHVMGSNLYVENNEAIKIGGPLPLMAPGGVRHQSQASHEAALDQLETDGVRVIRDASIEDVRLRGRTLDAIEVAAESRGVERGRAFVWALSSLETSRFQENIVKSLYPDGALQPSWAWVRYRVRLKGNSASLALPLWFAMVENEYLPLTHANFAMVKRLQSVAKRSQGKKEKLSVEPDTDTVRLDVWLRAPVRSLRDRDYIERLGNELLAHLAARVPLSEPACEKLPIESDTEADEPLIRFAIYEPREMEKFTICHGNNLIFDGPEQWDGLDWMNRLAHSRAVLETLEKLRAMWIVADRQAGREETQP